MVGRAARTEAAEWMRTAHQELSQRRAAKLVGSPRSTLRYRARESKDRQRRRQAIRELAFRHPRYGYRRIAQKLNKTPEWEKTPVNHKCVRRVMREDKLQVRPRRRRKWRSRQAVAAVTAVSQPDQRWAMDFVFDWCSNGRQLKIFTLVDQFTRENFALESGHSLPAKRVVEVLEELRRKGRCPKEIRLDSGPEFISKTLLRWSERHQVKLLHIEPGKPMQNGHVESFNGKLRDECLDTHTFWNLVDAQMKLKRFWKEYNSQRPHSSLNGDTPWEFAARHGLKPTFVSPTIDTARRGCRQANPCGSLRSGLTATTSRRKRIRHRDEGRP
jgi:putative transposase